VEPFNMPNAGAVPGEGTPSQSRRVARRGLIRRAALMLRERLIDTRIWYLRTVFGMDIHPSARISLKANLDKTNPRGVHVAEGSYVAFNAVILAHDMSRLLHTDTYIGRNCFIGAHAIIMPGVRVGNQCIVGSGAVVTRDVPPQSIVVGNPAKVVRSGIRTIAWGILEDAHNEAKAAELKARSSDFFDD
jgi:acetyltransferase-like isoleucine patch superfamily enzyme